MFQTLLKTAGGGKTMVFLITDTQIKEESFLEDNDSLLNYVSDFTKDSRRG